MTAVAVRSTHERLRPLVQAERLAVWSTPTARVLLLGSAVMAVVTGSANLATASDAGSVETLQLTMHAATVPALLFAAVAGAYASSSDHRYGTIDQQLLTDPSRRRWFLAKAQVMLLVGLSYGVVGMVAAVADLVGYGAVTGNEMDLVSPTVARALVGVGIATPLNALLGVCVGSLMRNQPVAIGTVLVWLLVIEPPLILGMPDVGRWLPGPAGLAATSSPDPSLLSPVVGALVLLIETAVALVVTSRVIARMDAR
ncbi:MAG: hypothetical protein R2733_09585 [Acidimicrobiales bacterium]